jgi:pimeloyl-ACP methyl ester carboxylesterase
MPVSLVLVHSPLVGPITWEALARALRERDHEVLVPDLTGSLTGGPPYLSRQIDAIIHTAAGQQVIIVGHSGAGPLLAPAGEALDRVAGYVFVDAGLPYPGQSWMDTAPPELAEQMRAMTTGGWLPPWSEWWGADGLAELLPDPDVRERFAAGCPRLPIAMFEETQPPAPSWPDAPCGYLRLSEVYQEPADRAKALDWPVIELASHHLAVLTDPELVVYALLDLVGQLQWEPPRSAR